MPIVPASKADPDDLDYAPIRPSQKDRDTDDIKKKLQKIESDRREALKRKENSSQLKPPTESGYTHPTFDEEHGCWKIQSLKDSRTVKIWDEKRDIWRDKPRNNSNDANGVKLLEGEHRAESWFQSVSRKASVWFGIKKGK